MSRRLTPARVVLWCAAISVLSLVITAPAAAVTHLWTSAFNGNFETAGNWTPAGPVGINDTAQFNATFQAYTVTFNSSPINDVLDFNDGDVTFRSSGVDRTYNVTNGAADALLDGGTLTLGVSGDPLHLNIGDVLQIRGGSTLSAEFGSDVTVGIAFIGYNSLGGTAIFDGPSTFTVNTSGVSLGNSGGTGTLTFQNSSTGNSITGTTFLINSSQANSTGRVNVLSGSTLQTDNIVVGFSGSTTVVQEATLTVSGANSVLTQTGASTLTIGDDFNPNIVADVILSGGGELITGTGAILIRNSGHLDIQGSGSTFTNNGALTADGTTIDQAFGGIFANGTGSSLLAQNGAQLNFDDDQTIDNGATWTLQSGADYNTDSTTDDLFVGNNSSNGTLVVENSGSSLNIGNGTSGLTQIGENGATGTVTIRDFATAFLGTLDVADDGDAGTTGTLNIEDGAQVTSNSVDVANVAGSTTSGTINIGGTTGTAQLTMNGASTLDVGASTFGSATINLTSGGQLNTGTGTTTVNSTGLIDIDGGALDLNGDLIINGGEVRRQSGVLVDEPGSNITLNNGGQLNLTGSFDINSGVVVTVNSGSSYSSTGFTDIGDGGDGTLIVDGAGSSATIGGGSFWGNGGNTALVTLRNDATGSFGNGDIINTGASTAIFEAQSGADLTFTGTTNINADGDAGSTGTLTATGTGSTVTMSSGTTMNIGHASLGTATLNVLDGGTFTKNVGTLNLHPTGTINLDGGAMAVNLLNDVGGTFNYVGGSLSMNSDFDFTLFAVNQLTLGTGDAIATTGTATIAALQTLTLDGGSLSASTLVQNGSIVFDSGTLSITGAGGSSIGASGPFGSVVSLGAGQNFLVTNTLAVDSTATLVVGTGANVEAGTLANSGSIVLDGAAAIVGGTAFTNSGLLRGEGVVSANLTNNANGEVRAQLGKTLTLTGTSGANAGKINLQGGTLELSQTLTNGSTGNILGRGTLVVGGAGLTNQGDIALSNGQTDIFGDVDNQGTGRVLISGNSDVTFWDDVTHTGTAFNVSSGSSVTFFGTAGFGITGDLSEVFFEADVTPGASPGLETFGGNVHFGVLANLEIEIGGLLAGSEFDMLDIAGTADLDGTLDVSLLGGFSPLAGDTFEILSAAGGLSGIFATENLPALTGQLFWNVNYDTLNDLVVLEVLSPFTADFDLDGDVDGDDLGDWEASFGLNSDADADGDTDTDGRDFLFWQRQHTGPGVPPLATSQAVPEPSSAALFSLAVVSCFVRRWRRR